MDASVVDRSHAFVPCIFCPTCLRTAFYVDFLKDTNAWEHRSHGNWAVGTVKHYRRLGMALPFSSASKPGLNSIGVEANMEGQLGKICMCPKNSYPSEGPNLAHVSHLGHLWT